MLIKYILKLCQQDDNFYLIALYYLVGHRITQIKH